jgi:hypothetical protein
MLHVFKKLLLRKTSVFYMKWCWHLFYLRSLHGPMGVIMMTGNYKIQRGHGVMTLTLSFTKIHLLAQKSLGIKK